MIRTILLIAVVLCIALGGGTASVWYLLKGNIGIGAVEIGGWTAFPEVGTRDADTYSKARFAREGGLALGQAEGIAFFALRDAGGQILRRECRYTVDGTVPTSRFWTIYAADADRVVLPAVGRRAPALHSREMLRDAADAVHINVGRHPAPGNWLTVTGSGPMQLVLTLYDSPVSSSARVQQVTLPRIMREGCDD